MLIPLAAISFTTVPRDGVGGLPLAIFMFLGYVGLAFYAYWGIRKIDQFGLSKEEKRKLNKKPFIISLIIGFIILVLTGFIIYKAFFCLG